MELYRGWIPTVAGRLSFRKIGKAYNYGRAQRSLISIGSALYILAWAERYTGDCHIPSTWLKRRYHRVRGQEGHHVFAILVTPDTSSLPPSPEEATPLKQVTGTAFAFSSDAFHKSKTIPYQHIRDKAPELFRAIWESNPRGPAFQYSLEDLFQEFHNIVRNIEKSIYSEIETRSSRFKTIPKSIYENESSNLTKIHDDLKNILMENSLIEADFELCKTGIVTIKGISTNFTSEEYLNGDHIQSSEFSSDEKLQYQIDITKHRIIDQIFYAIRDFSHTHKHHDKKSDNFSYTYHLKDNEDKSWVWKIISDYHHRLVALKRGEDSVAAQALGYSAYVTALEAILQRDHSDETEKIDPPYLRNNQVASIQSSLTISNATNSLKRHEQLSLAFAGILLPVWIASIISCLTVSVTLKSNTENPIPESFIDSLITSIPIQISITLTLIVMFAATFSKSVKSFRKILSNAKKYTSELICILRIDNPLTIILIISVYAIILSWIYTLSSFID